MAYKKNPQGTTPAGIAGWTCINKPSTKFNVKGEYSLVLALAAEEAAPLIETLKTSATEAKAEFLSREKDPKKLAAIRTFALNIPGTPEIGDDGNETGNVLFKFKQIAVITPKDKSKEPFEVTIGRYDAKGKPMPSALIVGKGSKLKVAYEIVPFCMAATKKVGVSLRLKAVQVLELVKYTPGGNAESYGFGEEDGYTGEEGGTESTFPTNAPEGGTGESGDF